MIATVLLIAFTVAVGGILSMWLTTLTSTQTTTTGSAAEKQILCSRSVLTIDEVTSSLAFSTNNTFNVTVVYTYGTEDLYYFNLTFVDNLRNSITLTPKMSTSKNFNKTDPFQPGMMYVFSIVANDTSASVERTGNLTGTSLYSVRVRATCQDNYPILAECKSGQSCMV
jgi:hypothetical protein